MGHTAFTETRRRDGREEHRSRCDDCDWTSTWQPGDKYHADNAGRMHEELRAGIYRR